MLFNNILETIGDTPLVQLNTVNTGFAKVLAKIESFNPGGSVKDRPAFNMIKRAEAEGLLTEGTVIIEPTSGNTGVGLAMVAAVKGYKLILTMPDTMSQERRNLLKAYGAELVLTEGKKGMKGAIEKVEELKKEYDKVFVPGQFVNSANPEVHEKYTAKEILKDTDGNIDIFVSGVGTGGTITGVGKALKEYNKDIQVVAVEPDNSPVLSGGNPGPHTIQGIGAGFVPDVLNTKVFDKVIKIKDEDAKEAMRNMSRKEGILVGISSGAAIAAALQLSNLSENEGKRIVVVLPDTGERYLSLNLYD